MESTRERILSTALSLFARNGYEAVSVRDIAGVLGMSQSALYKHYASKRHIFDSIVEKMRREDSERAKAFSLPEGTLSEMEQSYKAAAVEQIKSFTLAQFNYWTADAFASDFRRMLTLEQYRSGEMTALYQQYQSGGIVDYLEDLFRETEDIGGGLDCALLAAEYYGPVYILMNMYDAAENREEIEARVRAHVDRFFNSLDTKINQ